MRFDKRPLFNTILGFIPYWDYKSSGNDYYSRIFGNLSVFNEIHIKSGSIDGSVINGVRQPKLQRFLVDKPPSYKFFYQPETIQYKK